MRQYILLLLLLTPFFSLAANLQYEVNDVLTVDNNNEIGEEEFNEYNLQLRTNQIIELALTSDNGELVLAFLDHRFEFDTDKIITRYYQNISTIELSFLFITLKNQGFYRYTALEPLDGKMIVFPQNQRSGQINYKLQSSVELNHSAWDYSRIVVPAILFVATVFFWRIIGYKKIKIDDF